MKKKFDRKEFYRRLRSGEYKKCKGQLGFEIEERKESYRCTVGVICDMAVDAGVIPRFQQLGTLYYGYNESETYAPKEIWNWVRISFDDNEVDLMELNDETDMTLAEIADYIEKNEDKYFLDEEREIGTSTQENGNA